MNSFRIALLIPFTAGSLLCSGQRLKKSDRTIVSNLQAHLTYLTNNKEAMGKTGSASGKSASEYIGGHFQTYGLSPRGNNGTWYQPFDIYEGKFIQSSTQLSINGEKLSLLKDYFPLAFSANDKTEAAVTMALAENGVPWFKELGDIMDGHSSATVPEIMEIIKEKANHAASKGATALFIYNHSKNPELYFDPMDSSATLRIPVIYLTKNASSKYFADEMATLDVKINVAIEEKTRSARNILGFADNKADSTIIAAACSEENADIAALLELARLSKTIRPRTFNYLFIVYGGGKQGLAGESYFKATPSINLNKVNYSFNLDTVQTHNEIATGLTLVKRSMDIIRQNSHP